MKSRTRAHHHLKLTQLQNQILRDRSPELTGNVGAYLRIIVTRIRSILDDLDVSE